MAHEWVVALAITAAAQPLPAPPIAAPAAGPDARYCLRVGPVTGSLVEQVRCWTREAWAQQGVDVDREWAKEGVAVLK
jgi:hypothetical protein